MARTADPLSLFLFLLTYPITTSLTLVEKTREEVAVFAK